MCNDHKFDNELICKRCFKPFRKVATHLYVEIVRVIKGLTQRQKAAILYRRYLASD